MEEVLIAEKRGDDLRKFELSDPGYVYGTEKLPKGRRQKRKPKVEMLPMIELFELLFKAGIGVNIAISDQEKEFCVQSNCEQSEYQIFKFNVWLEEENIRRGYQREAILLNDPSVKAAANFLRSINFFAEF
ncbi:hypothetical protein AB6A40_009419 [Gnathostoma spinigerum]|uniref:Uncharacterized protein n=1 Tax=Gnathostoma spinigerum TaxID=75299 RepID=A0ABD6F1K2_9BILA